jgi:hypothetical protein
VIDVYFIVDIHRALPSRFAVNIRLCFLTRYTNLIARSDVPRPVHNEAHEEEAMNILEIASALIPGSRGEKPEAN